MNPRATPPPSETAEAHQVSLAEAFWDREYRTGRFLDLPPDAFVADILAAADRHALLPGPGLCIGPGNGRNYLPLVAGGLDLVGLDISAVGLAALRDRAPERAGRLVHGDLSALPPGETYPVVVGLNVFQHGTREQSHAHIRAAFERVAPDGLFCIAVNSTGARSSLPHEITDRYEDGSFTVRYDVPDAPGLYSHFYGEDSLAGLLADGQSLLPLRVDDIDPATNAPGPWRRWRAIYRRPALPRRALN